MGVRTFPLTSPQEVTIRITPTTPMANIRESKKANEKHCYRSGEETKQTPIYHVSQARIAIGWFLTVGQNRGIPSTTAKYYA